MASYIAGDTIRLLCTFKDFSGALATPTLINVKIYDQKYTLVNTYSVDLTVNNLSQGNYFYDYTIPSQYVNTNLFYEWYAEYNGVPSLNRGQFQVVFINS
jgi:hypothetical protein